MKVIKVAEALEKDLRLRDLFIEQEEPVYCVRAQKGTKKHISFRALCDNNRQFWKTKSDWSFYLLEENVEEALTRLREEDENRRLEDSRRRSSLMGLKDEIPKDDIPEMGLNAVSSGNGSTEHASAKSPSENFDSSYESIRSLPSDEKSNLVYRDTDALNKLLADPNRSDEEVAEALDTSTKDTSLANKTILEEALKMGDEEAKEFTRDMVERTKEMVRSSTGLLGETILKDELFNSIVERSNGTVVQHMTRTYLKSVSFLLYYNNKLQKSSFANKVRGQFPRKYRDYYWKLLPHFHKEDVVLERVFQSGLQAVSTDQVHDFATGFLVHDVGKAKDIEYHEGNAAYDREKVVDHVRQGYNAIMHKTVYPPQAGLITGYHHEYYGHSSGYGFHRAFSLRHKQKNPKSQPGYCISYTVSGILNFQAIAYFPAKILEIIDVFDALTDPNRVYRKPLARDEALTLMQEQFVDENLKIDPILFHIFQEYIESQ